MFFKIFHSVFLLKNIIIGQVSNRPFKTVLCKPHKQSWFYISVYNILYHNCLNNSTIKFKKTSKINKKITFRSNRLINNIKVWHNLLIKRIYLYKTYYPNAYSSHGKAYRRKSLIIYCSADKRNLLLFVPTQSGGMENFYARRKNFL